MIWGADRIPDYSDKATKKTSFSFISNETSGVIFSAIVFLTLFRNKRGVMTLLTTLATKSGKLFASSHSDIYTVVLGDISNGMVSGIASLKMLGFTFCNA